MSLTEFLSNLDNKCFSDTMTKCCASTQWVRQMTASRPFDHDEQLFAMATQIWWSLAKDDWREAFAAHPRIGDVDSLRAKFSNTQSWASGEQSGVTGASEETLSQLAVGNDRYWKRFGYIFIVFATGKTASEMLDILERRLDNHAGDEIRIAAEEQLKITLLRLEKLVD